MIEKTESVPALMGLMFQNRSQIAKKATNKVIAKCGKEMDICDQVKERVDPVDRGCIWRYM